MIIILTNKDDITVDFVVRELHKQNLEYYRLNTEDIPSSIELRFILDEDAFFLYDKNKERMIDLKKVEAVYFRRAEVSSLDYITDISISEKKYLREELAYILEGIYKVLRDKYWLNNIYNIREAENKIYQLQIAKEIGFIIPKSIISNNLANIEKMVIQCKEDCIIKPIKSGNLKDGKCPQIIFTSKIDKKFLADKNRVASFPLFVQKNIHKRFDLRCIVVGETVYCAQIDSQIDLDSKVDWRKSKKYLKHANHILPADIANKCIAMTKMLRLNYSAIDLILDENNNYIFLECNPNGQWAWLEKRLDFPISEHIVELLKRGASNENM